jgi:hypothetical protein
MRLGNVFLPEPGTNDYERNFNIAITQALREVYARISALEGYKWDGVHPIHGVYHLWIDSTGDLRIKSSQPTSDTDGTVIGTQT